MAKAGVKKPQPIATCICCKRDNQKIVGRGMCQACATVARQAIKSGEVKWAELESLGLALPCQRGQQESLFHARLAAARASAAAIDNAALIEGRNDLAAYLLREGPQKPQVIQAELPCSPLLLAKLIDSPRFCRGAGGVVGLTKA